MTDHRLRRMHTKVMKAYAEEASEMTRDELEHAYVKVRFAHTSFAHFSHRFFDDINEEDEHLY